MTKEEIIEQHPILVHIIGGHGIGAFQLIGKAMDEYAKKQAIAYCEWYCSLGYLPKVKNKEDYKPGESYMKSHEQLYKEFIEQQNEDNGSVSDR